MEDKGLGNIIFYIILALIGLAGSFSNKKTKGSAPGAPKKTFTWPDFEGEATHTFPDVFDSETQPENPRPAVKPATRPVVINEGRYEDPVAGAFSGEGDYKYSMSER